MHGKPFGSFRKALSPTTIHSQIPFRLDKTLFVDDAAYLLYGICAQVQEAAGRLLKHF
jgi:hypothetical protein